MDRIYIQYPVSSSRSSRSEHQVILDKNHAGILIIWDRMFGTFQEEEEEVVFGITKPLDSWNPLWANVHQFVELWEDAKAAPYWCDKIRLWFMPPDCVRVDCRSGLVTPNNTANNSEETMKPNAPRPHRYIALHFVITLSVSLGVLASKSDSVWSLLAPAAYITLALVSIGGFLNVVTGRW